MLRLRPSSTSVVSALRLALAWRGGGHNSHIASSRILYTGYHSCTLAIVHSHVVDGYISGREAHREASKDQRRRGAGFPLKSPLPLSPSLSFWRVTPGRLMGAPSKDPAPGLKAEHECEGNPTNPWHPPLHNDPHTTARYESVSSPHTQRSLCGGGRVTRIRRISLTLRQANPAPPRSSHTQPDPAPDV
jgi:hypothetical protein